MDSIPLPPTPPTYAKVAQTSADPITDSLKTIKSLFPEAWPENGDKLDFERLRALLEDHLLDPTAERYIFSWAGKRDAVNLLRTPSRATLVPDQAGSVDFDTSQNLFIEGDNLEVLKLLYKPYFGRVKMIYIDPPYNTGHDFVYPDNYSDSLDSYLKLTGQKDGNGNHASDNLETTGRHHSNWLSMMYPRLFLARQLLRDDGVIFVSIDDNEVTHLRMLMDQVFGEENFLAEYVWKARSGKSGTITSSVSYQHEYIVCYSKDSDPSLKLQEKVQSGGNYEDEIGKYKREQLRQWGQADRREDRPQMFYSIKHSEEIEIYPIKDDGSEGRWRVGRATAEQLASSNDLDFEFDGTRWQVYKKIREGRTTYSAFGTILDKVGVTADGTKVVQDLFGAKVMDFPKPPTLIKFLIELATEDDQNCIVLDFFAGSGTTAQAVLELNREDGGNRRFVLVQLPEPTPPGSVAAKAKYKNIADIGKERVRRVSQRMKANPGGNGHGKKNGNGKKNGQGNGEGQLALALETRATPEDLGFRVFKLAASNYKPKEMLPPGSSYDALVGQMQLFYDPLVENWQPLNVIYEVAIKSGFGLDCRIEPLLPVTRDGVTSHFWRVTDDEKAQYFHVCLDGKPDAQGNGLSLATFESLGLNRDERFVCREVAIDGDDTLVANIALQCRLNTI